MNSIIFTIDRYDDMIINKKQKKGKLINKYNG